jgi:hypothetical protein
MPRTPENTPLDLAIVKESQLGLAHARFSSHVPGLKRVYESPRFWMAW